MLLHNRVKDMVTLELHHKAVITMNHVMDVLWVLVITIHVKWNGMKRHNVRLHVFIHHNITFSSLGSTWLGKSFVITAVINTCVWCHIFQIWNGDETSWQSADVRYNTITCLGECMVQIKWDGWSLEPCITTLTYPCYKRCHGSSCADGEKKIPIIIMSGSLGLWAVIGKTVTSWTWMC